MALVYIFTALVAFLAQCFYIYRIYRLSQSVIVVFQIEMTSQRSHGLTVPNPHKGLESSVLTWIYRGATCC